MSKPLPSWILPVASLDNPPFSSGTDGASASAGSNATPSPTPADMAAIAVNIKRRRRHSSLARSSSSIFEEAIYSIAKRGIPRYVDEEDKQMQRERTLYEIETAKINLELLKQKTEREKQQRQREEEEKELEHKVKMAKLRKELALLQQDP